MDGFDAYGGWGVRFRDDAGDELLLRRPIVVEPLRWRHSMCAEEWTYLRARTTRPGKVTIISAMQAASYYEPDRSGGAYATREAYMADVVALLRQEVDELVRLGCTYIQVDGPAYGSLVDERMRKGYTDRGANPDRLLDEAIELDNAIIAGYPDVTFALHICRGNNQSHYYASGGYEPIARVLERTDFQRFMLEYDTERSGGFEPLRHLPEDRIAVLGVDHDQATGARVGGRGQRPPDRSRALRPSRTSGPQHAVRLCLHDRGQSCHGGRSTPQARARRADRK